MKNTLLSSLFILFQSVLFAQTDDLRIPEKENKKHFIAAGYGIGNANWFSKLVDTKLYNKDGTVLKSGDLAFKAKNPVSYTAYEVSFPVAKVRLGVGISFEEFYLDKLQIKNSSGNDASLLLFDETFRFDKIYTQVEVPIKMKFHPRFSFDFKGHLGYFGYNGIERLNFFGEEAMAKTFYTTVGIIADFKVFSQTYIYFYPNIEYKFFRNSRLESPSKINHNIITESLQLGVRVDLSRE